MVRFMSTVTIDISLTLEAPHFFSNCFEETARVNVNKFWDRQSTVGVILFMVDFKLKYKSCLFHSFYCPPLCHCESINKNIYNALWCLDPKNWSLWTFSRTNLRKTLKLCQDIELFCCPSKHRLISSWKALAFEKPWSRSSWRWLTGS